MKKITITLTILASLLVGCASATNVTAENVKVKPATRVTFEQKWKKDALVGFYKGTVECAKKLYPATYSPELYAEVYRGPDAKYRLRLLPALMNRCEDYFVAENLKAENGEIKFDKASLAYNIKGIITPKEIVAEGMVYGKTPVKINLKRFDWKSPTLGKKAPEGATVLFDGKDLDKWRHGDPAEQVKWLLKDDYMIAQRATKDKATNKRKGGSIFTREKFGAFDLHLEFRFPCEYNKLGQGRSNSGVIIGDYEVQVLDSFGTPALWNECGSVYRQVAPLVNACIEPGAWQTYDIEFRPAELDSKGNLKKLPYVTVYLNGVLVQRETPIQYKTSLFPVEGRKYKHKADPVSIQLQDHSNPIEYRNIWLEKK